MKITKKNISKIYSKYSVSRDRAKHSLGVAEIAVRLAALNGISTEKAWLAGALHDLARDWTTQRRTSYTDSHHILFTDEEKEIPYITHGKIAANIAKTELGVTDNDVLLAISTHTSGDENMNTLQAIIYVADYMESTSKDLTLKSIHEQTYKDLYSGINRINLDTLEYLKSTNRKPTQEFLRNLAFYSKHS